MLRKSIIGDDTDIISRELKNSSCNIGNVLQLMIKFETILEVRTLCILSPWQADWVCMICIFGSGHEGGPVLLPGFAIV